MEKMLLGILLLLLGNLARAEGGCPPGMIPYSGTDIRTCGPLPPDYSKPKGHWETRWGTYALSENEGITGWSSNQPSSNASEKMAIENCVAKGGSQCKVRVTYRNTCIAVSTSDGGGYSYINERRDEAIKNSIKSCKKADERNCRLFRAECSPAKWVDD